METNETILTEEQIKSINEVVEKNKTETDELMEQIEKEHENDDNSNAPLEEGEGYYISDGTIMEAKDDDFNHFENIDSDLNALVEENIKTNITDKFNLSDEEALKFVNTISRVRAKEKFNIYNELPESIKKYIDDAIEYQELPQRDKKLYLNGMAKMFIEELINDAEFESLSINLEQAMKELIPTPLEMYSETNRDYIENKFLEVAESIKDKNPNEANNLLNMRQGFIDAYTLEPMYKVFENFKIMNKVRKAKKLWSRVENDYTSVVGKCKFTLYALKDLHTALTEIGISNETSYKMIALFTYTYIDGIEDFNDEKEYNDIYRNSFANYFEMNIRNLAIMNTEASEFSKLIKENIIKLSNHIETVITKRETELLSNKKKKR